MFELKKLIIVNEVAPVLRRKWALLACENNPPYGPPQHTAQLFLELIYQAARLADNSASYDLQIDVYNVIAEEYPTQWDDYQGIFLPGSFAAAYDTDAWILTLRNQLQMNIVAPERPTLAVCFGHQIMAHSFFPQGKAVQMQQARAGRHDVVSTERTTCLGTSLFSQFFSHGDRVEQLPETAVAWGSSDPDVPVQIAAYYGSKSDQPYCISFQAHPEYATEDGLGTLLGCMEAMKERNAMTEEDYQRQVQDAFDTCDSVKAANLDVMLRVFQTLGWFPTN